MKLLCPHCERELDERHRKDGCSTRFTRRFLFGLLGGATAAMALPDVWNKDLIIYKGDRLYVHFTAAQSAVWVSVKLENASRHNFLALLDPGTPKFICPDKMTIINVLGIDANAKRTFDVLPYLDIQK